MIEAKPRSQPKPLPVFPNPAPRPDGSLPPLVLEFFSEVPDGIGLALGKVPKRDAAAYVRAIRNAGPRSIICKINCAGGEADGALAIATALLEHQFAVHCHVIRRCCSAAAFIALAADKRTIVEDGYVLLHRARRLCTPEQWDSVRRLHASEQQAINNSLADIDDASAVLLRDRLGVSEATARSWLNGDKRWTAEEAIEKGFCSSIAADLEIAS
jgi:ATP-dependent protease ClpP protease subunit